MSLYLQVGQEGLLGGGASVPLAIVLDAKADADLVVEDESPYEAQDQLQVVVHNVTTACGGREGGREGNSMYYPVLSGCRCGYRVCPVCHNFE